MVDGPDSERVADQFAVLAHPLRVRILLALAETRQPSLKQRGMSYTALRSTLDEPPGGRFNYHLGELQGEFVRSEEGHYWLTGPGSRAVNEMYAGTFDESVPTISGPLDEECPKDGNQLTGSFKDGVFSKSCPEHGVISRRTMLFNVAADRTVKELSVLATLETLQTIESIVRDVCPHCAGRFEAPTVETVSVDDRDWVEVLGVEETVTVTLECQRCGFPNMAPAYYFGLIRTPTRVFLYEHGIDLHSPEWEPGTVATNHSTRLLEDGVLIRFELESEHLEIELDRSLDVRSHRRLSTDASG